MNIAETIVLIICLTLVVIVGGLYFINSKKINKKTKVDTKKTDNPQSNPQKPVEIEQKPVAVGIIQEKAKTKQEDGDFANFREKEEISQKEKIKKEVNNLTPEMKKIIVSDLLKPKF